MHAHFMVVLMDPVMIINASLSLSSHTCCFGIGPHIVGRNSRIENVLVKFAVLSSFISEQASTRREIPAVIHLLQPTKHLRSNELDHT